MHTTDQDISQLLKDDSDVSLRRTKKKNHRKQHRQQPDDEFLISVKLQSNEEMTQRDLIDAIPGEQNSSSSSKLIKKVKKGM